MPPKGWRKNAEGAYPVTSKERDSISIEDILFPKATVNRLARAIIPDGGILSKDSSTVVQRSSTVFVNYLLIHARQNAKKYDRKTIGPQDVLAALEQAEFSSFIPSVQQELDIYQAHKDALKQKRKEEKERAAADKDKEEQTETETGAQKGSEISDVSEAKEIEQADREVTEEAENIVDKAEDKVLEDGPESKKAKTREDTVSETES